MSRRFAYFVTALVAVALVAIVAPHAFAAVVTLAQSGHSHVVAGPALAMGLLSLPAPITDVATLDQQRTAPRGGFEIVEDVIFDTFTYLAAGPGAADIPVFNQIRGDATLSNLEQPGKLPANQRFHVRKLFVYPLLEPALKAGIADAAGLARDVDRVFNTSRGIFSFTTSRTGRTRRIPIDMPGAPSHSLVMFGGSSAPAAGNAAIVEAPKLQAHGGFPFDTIIGPGEEFSGVVRFGNSLPITGNMLVRIALFGWRYVPVG